MLLSFVCFLYLTGCSNYKDQQTVPPENLPESVIKVMSDAYPDATNATFQSIEKDKLYEVYYKLKGDSFHAALNTKKILSVYRMYGTLPDSMRQALPARSVSGGEADVYKEPVPQVNADKIFNAKYTWKGQNYLLSWFEHKPLNPARFTIRIEPYVKFTYQIFQDEINAMPTPILAFFDREKLRISTVRIAITEKNERQYLISATTASGTGYEFVFDRTAKLINTIYRAEAFYYNIDELPEKIQTFIKNSSAFAAMKLAEGYKFSDPVGTGYVLNLQGTEESSRMSFDQDGNFVSMTYQTALYR